MYPSSQVAHSVSEVQSSDRRRTGRGVNVPHDTDGAAVAGSTDELGLPALVCKLVLAAALAGALFFETAYFLGWFADGGAYRQTLFSVLYAFDLVVVFVSACAVFLVFWRTRRVVFLLAAVGIFSWFLGSFFFVSYVFLLKRILIYPSVAEFAFQGFHLLVITVLYNHLRASGDGFFKPAAVVVPIITLMPAAGLINGRIPLNNLLYSTLFMFLVSLTTFLVINLLVRRRLPVLCIGLAAVIVADIVFVETSLAHSVYVFSLDPIWFTGFALTAYGFVLGAQRGELA